MKSDQRSRNNAELIKIRERTIKKYDEQPQFVGE
jgi:hypothetical protein